MHQLCSSVLYTSAQNIMRGTHAHFLFSDKKMGYFAI
jgi:hypothetical protein